MLFQIHKGGIFQWDSIMTGSIAGPSETAYACWYVTPSNEKEIQKFLGMINYLGKFSPSTAEVCKLLRK